MTTVLCTFLHITLLFAICKVSALEDNVWNIFKVLYPKLTINTYTQAGNSGSQSAIAQFYQFFFVIVENSSFHSLHIYTLFITFEQHTVSAIQKKRNQYNFSTRNYRLNRNGDFCKESQVSKTITEGKVNPRAVSNGFLYVCNGNFVVFWVQVMGAFSLP